VAVSSTDVGVGGVLSLLRVISGGSSIAEERGIRLSFFGVVSLQAVKGRRLVALVRGRPRTVWMPSS
jgi:hypothetical protein